MQAFTVQVFTVQVLAAQNCNMRTTVIFMILAIVVCAMVQESEQQFGRSMMASSGVHINAHGSIGIKRGGGWRYQECPMRMLRNICEGILAYGRPETTTYENTMPYTDWDYQTTTARSWSAGKK